MFGIGNCGSMGAVARSGSGGSGPIVPGFVPIADGIAADIYMDFVNGNYFGKQPSDITCTRATVAYGDNQAGVWSAFAANTPVLTNKGLQYGGAATNRALWARDMTQTAWVKTRATAALTQTGIDGTANSASLLTATAANATVLQNLTLASNTDIYSVFLRRVSGSGTVNLTVDGGTTLTPVTLTTSFQRFQISQATVVNPSFGIGIVTSGDSIVADFNQLQTMTAASNSLATSPLLTTTALLAGAADVLTITAAPGSAITLLANTVPQAGPNGNPIILQISDGSVSNRTSVFRSGANPRAQMLVGGTLLGGANTTGSYTEGTLGKLAGTFNGTLVNACFNAGAVASAAVTGFPAGMNQINMGQVTGALGWFYLQSFAVWLNHFSSNTALQVLTSTTGTAMSITLSTTSVTFATAMDANSFVATITVTAGGGGTYVGVLTLGGTDAANFALSNGGNYPCNLMIGPANIGAGTYAISLTANP
jgi:hypothetical protein